MIVNIGALRRLCGEPQLHFLKDVPEPEISAAALAFQGGPTEGTMEDWEELNKVHALLQAQFASYPTPPQQSVPAVAMLPPKSGAVVDTDANAAGVASSLDAAPRAITSAQQAPSGMNTSAPINVDIQSLIRQKLRALNPALLASAAATAAALSAAPAPDGNTSAGTTAIPMEVDYVEPALPVSSGAAAASVPILEESNAEDSSELDWTAVPDEKDFLTRWDGIVPGLGAAVSMARNGTGSFDHVDEILKTRSAALEEHMHSALLKSEVVEVRNAYCRRKGAFDVCLFGFYIFIVLDSEILIVTNFFFFLFFFKFCRSALK